MIPKKLESDILRLRNAESWPVGTIAEQLHIHHSVVARVLDQAGLPRPSPAQRPSIVDPYLPFVAETLDKYPRLCASRLFDMVKARGYPGGPAHFRRIVARYRPQPPAEAYLRIRTLPGEEAQVDWGHFGKVAVGRAIRSLVGFVMVLSWSRKIFLRFFLNHQLANFLRGHQEAFAFFGGIPRACLYDNLRSVVLERRGDAIRFHPTFLEFAGFHRFEPRPVNPARGNEKGRVERAIQYVRKSFFAARDWRDLEDLNRQALDWCEGTASDRPCPEDRTISVREAMTYEQESLLALPETTFPTEERKEVSVSKTPYARFDCNDYSVPHRYAQRNLVVLASETSVRILEGQAVVVEHPRSYDKGSQIEDPDHVRALLRKKRRARKGRGMDRLYHAIPKSQALFTCLAERGENLGAATSGLLRLLDQYGTQALEGAIIEALERNSPHLHSIRHILDRRFQEANRETPIPVTLPDDPRVRNVFVRPHSLGSYDGLKEEKNDDSETTTVHGTDGKAPVGAGKEPEPLGDGGTLG